MDPRPRVIVALSDATERAAVADWLSADGFEPVPRSTPQSAIDDVQLGRFDAMVADEGPATRVGLPALVLARNSTALTILIGEGEAKGKAVTGHIAYLARPIDRVTLICFVSMAIQERGPVRRSVRKPVNRFDVLVNGVPSHIVDVSAEGVRVEVPRDHRGVGLPHFTVQVPLVGVTITARRMWSSPSSRRMIAYGGALTPSRPSVQQGWQAFIDIVPVVGQRQA